MMIGLRSDPEATLFLTCQRAVWGWVGDWVQDWVGDWARVTCTAPIVYLGAANVISTPR
jgi:hypothetical protein